jgi:hypothetical protein
MLVSASFKFDGMTCTYYTTDGLPNDVDKFELHEYKVNQPTYKAYNFKTKEFIEKREYTGEAKEYYLVEIQSGRNDSGTINSHYTDHNCIDAIGTIYFFDFPEGVYNGQELQSHITVKGYGGIQLPDFDKLLEE